MACGGLAACRAVANKAATKQAAAKKAAKKKAVPKTAEPKTAEPKKAAKKQRRTEPGDVDVEWDSGEVQIRAGVQPTKAKGQARRKGRKVSHL